MAVQIGARTHTFSDPTGLLTDCHRRVEMFMASLMAVAQLCEIDLSDEVRHSLELALRYFREAAHKHTADEEQSLFPRLRAIDNPELKVALGALDGLEEDHRWAEPLHRLVNELGTQCLRAGKLSSPDADQFRGATQRLYEMYQRHIEVEEQVVFPIAKKVLSPELKAEMAKEMESRRGLKPVQKIS